LEVVVGVADGADGVGNADDAVGVDEGAVKVVDYAEGVEF
jgi:hypothetical protein